MPYLVFWLFVGGLALGGLFTVAATNMPAAFVLGMSVILSGIWVWLEGPEE